MEAEEGKYEGEGEEKQTIVNQLSLLLLYDSNGTTTNYTRQPSSKNKQHNKKPKQKPSHLNTSLH